MQKGLFTGTFLLCAPIVLIASFFVVMSPLGLGFSDGASERLNTYIGLVGYWVLILSAPLAVLGGLPLSASLAISEHSRRWGFRILLGLVFILIPLQFLFITWLSS